MTSHNEKGEVMTDIPEDVQKAALAVCEGLIACPNIRGVLFDRIVSAIMAERERYAKVAKDIAERHRNACLNYTNERFRDAARLASYTARCVDDVAAAIRAGRTEGK